MNSIVCIDIEKAIKLINRRKTTVDDIYKFLFSYIETFQDERTKAYFAEFKNGHEKELNALDNSRAAILEKKIANDVRQFVNKFVGASIDKVLDGMNEKVFKTKKGPRNLLTILVTLRDSYEKT